MRDAQKNTNNHQRTETNVPSTMLTEAQLAERLGLSRPTLRRWRRAGGGPTWLRLGARVLYPVAGLDAWLASRERAPAETPALPPAA